MVYIVKRRLVMDRLVEHQNKMESFLSNYYEVLDKVREQVLEREYRMHKQIDDYESRL